MLTVLQCLEEEKKVFLINKEKLNHNIDVYDKGGNFDTGDLDISYYQFFIVEGFISSVEFKNQTTTITLNTGFSQIIDSLNPLVHVDFESAKTEKNSKNEEELKIAIKRLEELKEHLNNSIDFFKNYKED